VITLLAVGVLISIIAGIWTDFLWYRSVSQTRVFTTTYSTRWLLFGVGAIFMMVAIGANIWLAYRLRPAEPPASTGQQGVEAYRQAIDPHRRGIMIVVLSLIGLISGLTASSNWQTWLLFVNRVTFGSKDPQFHLDLSFFVFVYPFLRLALSFLFAAILLSLVLATAVHVLYGGIRPARRAQPTPAARAHLFVLAGLFVALKGAAYWVDRYGISFSQRGVVQTGASYTDVNAVLPAKTVLAVIAVICALLFLAGAIRRSSLLPAIGFGLLVLSAVLIGGVYPFIIQQFVVKPNEQVKERPYIAREIASTRQAYGVAGAKIIGYQATAAENPAKLAIAAAAMPDLRLLDPGLVDAAFQQLQQVKGYYQFPSVLGMDRYVVAGNPLPQDMVVSVRDMAGPPAGQANWINTHLIYTHGYGFVAASASSAAADSGNPQFAESDIPPTGQLGSFQPRIYFGNEQASYVIVGGRQAELDYPFQNTGGQQNNTYHGGGGVPIGSFVSRLLYAVKFRDLNIMLSGAIDGQSRMIYVRNPLARVAKVAPFLTLDGDYYPVIEGGQILWVVDGYTTTDNYPYSKRLSLRQATSDTYNPGGSAIGPTNEVNYVRNSVKATVDAYTGAVHIYQWRTADPVLRTWMKVFPGLIRPQSDIPLELLPHLRYPEVLFSAQRQILAQFHVLQPQAFYGGQNFWSVPNDPTVPPQFSLSQPPYYLTLSMPGSPTPEFSLTSLFTPRARSNLAAFMAVNSDPSSPDYGQIQILQLPQDTSILGPQQVQSNFEADPPASIELTQLRKGGSRVTLGNLITVPLGGGLLSVEPIYVSASALNNNGSYPQLKRIFTFFDGQVGYANTLTASLAQLFGNIAGQGTGSGSGGGSNGGQVSAVVQADLQLAEKYYAQAQAALRDGDLALYAQDIAKVKLALDQAQQAAKPAGSSGAHPSATPTPTPTH
jgi:hypothetical protein